MGQRSVVVLKGAQFSENFGSSLLVTLAELSDAGAAVVLLEEPTGVEGPLDPFVVLAAIAERAPLSIGALVNLGHGRAASIAVREATSLEHLSRHGCVLGFASEDSAHLAEAMEVASSLLSGEARSAGGSFERIVDAPNLPGPRQRLSLFAFSAGQATVDGKPVELEILEGRRFN